MSHEPEMSTEIVQAQGGQELAANVMSEVASSRAIQEVQAAMLIAKKFPRDEALAMSRIKTACQRRGLAEVSHFEYPRGGEIVRGATIRLAEALATAWGNIDFGVVELERREYESTVLAAAWDMETNTRRHTTFTVPHERYTKRGTYPLTDPRDIYENMANNAARRLRSVILALIPGDVKEFAMRQCDETLQSGHDKPIADRRRDMLVAFREFGVDQEMIERRLGHKVDALTESGLVKLRRLYQAIKDGSTTVVEVFEPAPESVSAGEATAAADKLEKRLGEAQPQSESRPPRPPKPPKPE